MSVLSRQDGVALDPKGDRGEEMTAAGAFLAKAVADPKERQMVGA
jgi:hypothetical protein